MSIRSQYDQLIMYRWVATNGEITAADGIFYPQKPIVHREDEYSETGLATLAEIEDPHFWYRDRHRFLLKAVDRYNKEESTNRSAIDLGGIVGGWIRDLARKRPRKFQTLALADSSMRVDDGQGTLAAWYGEIPYRLDGFSDVRLLGRGFLARRHRTFSRRLGGDYRSKSRLKKRGCFYPDAGISGLLEL